MRPLARRVGKLTESATVALAERSRDMRAKGIDVIDLAAGDPDFATPAVIVDAAAAAMRAGFTHYVNSRGIPDLVAAIAEKLRKQNGLTLPEPGRQIIVTPSSKFALAAVFLGTLDPGDEVLVLTPGWVSYDAAIQIAGAIPVHVPLEGGENFRVTADTLRHYLTSRTKMILLNTPNNPTGRVLSEAELAAIADIAQGADLLVVSDEIYERVVYDGHAHVSPAVLPGMAERTIVVNGFSKTYAMTGWRLGYLVATPALIEGILKIQQHLVTCAASFVQRAGVVALADAETDTDRMVESYRRRRDLVVGRMNRIPGLRCPVPEGTFYAFVDVRESGWGSSAEFAHDVLERAHVALTPGAAFGGAGEGYVRLAFTQPEPELEKALDRISVILQARRS